MTKLQIIPRHLSGNATSRDWREYNHSFTRAYVSFDSSEIEMECPPMSVKGDDPELDKLWKRYNKLEVETMRRKIAEVANEIATLTGGRQITWRFSRKAGCSCGCSAGFIAEGIIIRTNDEDAYNRKPVDLYIR